MKKYLELVIILFVLFFGCENTNENNCDENLFKANDLNLDFSNNGTSFTELTGTWNLKNTIFYNEMGKIEHLENYYEIPDTNKNIKINNLNIFKTIFYAEPYYAFCLYSIDSNSTENVITLHPSGGSPTTIIEYNYAENELTFSYSTKIKSKECGKYYTGKIVEQYQK
ncbi:MAG: hypothetical protein IPH62_00740 [Ignavibacteriae bacterium]|nr:hypothetical protein [Ignavibacteriota bacterium]